MTIKLKRSTEEILKEKARKTDVSLSEITFLCFFEEHTKGKNYFSIYNEFIKSLNKNMMECYKSTENFTI